MANTIARLVETLPAESRLLELRSLPGLPVRVATALNRLGAADLNDLLDWTDDRFLEARNLSARSVAELREALRRLACLPEDWAPLETSPTFPTPVHEADATTDGHPSPSQRPGPLMVSTFMKGLVATLDTDVDGLRRSNILMARLGAFGQSETLDEVSQWLGITRERVRQIENAAFSRLRQAPIGKAVRHVVGTFVESRQFICIGELVELCPWLSDGIELRGLRLAIDNLASCTVVQAGRDTVIMARGLSESTTFALQLTLEYVMSMSPIETTEQDIEECAQRVANTAELPSAWPSIAFLIRRSLASRHVPLSTFVRHLILRSEQPLDVDTVAEMANAAGYSSSVDVVRNSIASNPDIFPIGNSRFGTFGQVFPTPTSLLDDIVEHLSKCVHESTGRQWHAEELFERVLTEFGEVVHIAIGDKHRLAMLLRVRSDLRYLGRLIFTTAGADQGRLELLPLAREALLRAGGAMHVEDLLSEMRKRRGVGVHSIQALLSQLIEVGPNRYDLPDRAHNVATFRRDLQLQLSL